jgi:hypothetical protein
VTLPHRLNITILKLKLEMRKEDENEDGIEKEENLGDPQI